MTKEELFSRIQSLADIIDSELLRLLSDDEPIPNLHDGMIYALGLDKPDRKTRGKRLRPAICVLTGEAMGVPSERTLAFACSIELLHNFALVHDDIEDGDEYRRGRPAVHIRYGLAHGVNIGDFLFAKIWKCLLQDASNPLKTRHQLMEVLDATHNRLFSGQALDIGARDKTAFSMADYERIVSLKTGSYLAAPILGATVIAGSDEASIQCIHRYGQAMGPLFQIKDDLIDLTAGKGRGAIGNDIREGKRSFLAAAALESGSPEQRVRLLEILDKPRAETSDSDIMEASEIFQQTGAISRAEERCQQLLEEGTAAIASLPEDLRLVLSTFSDLLLDRAQ